MPDEYGIISWAEARESNHRIIAFLKALPPGAKLFIENKPELTIEDAQMSAEILQVSMEALGRA
jgi:hypothetical protein